MMARQRLLPAMLLAMTTGAVADLAGQQGTDPFLWLEEVEGQRAMEWVLARNAETRAALQASPARFATSRSAKLCARPCRTAAMSCWSPASSSRPT